MAWLIITGCRLTTCYRLVLRYLTVCSCYALSTDVLEEPTQYFSPKGSAKCQYRQVRPNALPLPPPFDLGENRFLPCVAWSRAHARSADAVPGKEVVGEASSPQSLYQWVIAENKEPPNRPTDHKAGCASSPWLYFDCFYAEILLCSAQSVQRSQLLSCL